MDVPRVIDTLRQFIKAKLIQSGTDGYVIGLSGGIDSSLAAALAAQAIGSDQILGVLMPYRTSSEDSLRDARKLAEQLGIEYRLVEITPMIDAYYPVLDEKNRLRAGNKMARERMAILFDIAHELSRLVLGTGNRTETCLGYTTWHGDSACSVNPIGELYKTEVRQIARTLDLPATIINKPPTADLWVNQTDEGEIGISYETIDRLLRRMIDDEIRSVSKLESEGFAAMDISQVVSLLNRNAFKRRLPDVASLGRRPIPDRLEVQR